MVNLFDRHVGTRIKSLRLEMRLSQSQLAKSARVDATSIAAFEAGTMRADAETLLHIANALNVSLSSFFEGLNVDDR